MNEKLLAFYCKTVDFFKREDGASAIEYGIIAGLIAVVLITNVDNIGTSLNTIFGAINTDLAAARQ